MILRLFIKDSIDFLNVSWYFKNKGNIFDTKKTKGLMDPPWSLSTEPEVLSINYFIYTNTFFDTTEQSLQDMKHFNRGNMDFWIPCFICW